MKEEQIFSSPQDNYIIFVVESSEHIFKNNMAYISTIKYWRIRYLNHL